MPYILYLYLVALHQVILQEMTTIWGASLALAPLVITLVAIYKSQTLAIWFGCAMAFLVNTGDVAATAAGMIVAAAVAVGVGYFKGRLNLESLPARLTVVALGCLLFEFERVVFISPTEIHYLLLTVIIPSVVYTTVVAALFFAFKDGYITKEGFRKVF